MAPVYKMIRTCGLMFYLALSVFATPVQETLPQISSLEITAKNCVQNNCKYLLNIHGGDFRRFYSWRLSSSSDIEGAKCNKIYPDYELKVIEITQSITRLEIIVPFIEGIIYFCIHHKNMKTAPFEGTWNHLGEEWFLDPKADELSWKTSQISLSSTTTESTDTQKAALLDNVDQDLVDLSHDIDVNQLPIIKRPTREERNDIEMLVNDQYVPLNDIYNDNSIEVLSYNVGKRKKRDIDDFNSIQIKNHDIVTRNISNENLLKEDTFTEVPLISIEMNNDFDVISNNLDKRKNLEINSFKYNADSLNDFENNDVVEVFSNDFDRDVKKENSFKSIVDFGNNDFDSNSHEFGIKTKREIDNMIKDNLKSITDPVDDLMRTERGVVSDDFTSVKSVMQNVIVEGVRVEEASKDPKIVDDGIPSVLADSSVTLRLFGEGLTAGTVIAFTNYPQEFGQPCKFILKGEYRAQEESITKKSALFDITAPPSTTGQKLYICTKNLKPGVKDLTKDDEKYIHQGTESFKMLAIHDKLLPLWVSMLLIIVCLMFSALFSGLNLGLMSLDRTELKIIANTGTEQEREYARAIMPVRDHGNYLLCSILLGNVAVNSTFTILLDELTSGLFAVIFSTLAIVLLGEITPQAICSRHGLMVGAKSIMVTKSVMAVTAPLAFPISKLLDYFLGEEIGSVYNRERLKELVKLTTDVNDLDKDEVNIISGALELRKKSVSDVMTKLEDVFMLPINSVLDFETMSEIVKSGYSRIPVYESHRGNIVTVLFIKDLAFVDPDDNTPLRTLCQYYQNPCNFVFEDVTLDVMFKQFKEGHKGHMAFVHRINNEGEGDPFYETIGLVTLEDVIEEMIQAEIVDETDVFMDNRSKRRRNKPQHKLQDFAAFAERHDNQRVHISPQLTLATFQFLSSSVDAFRPDTVSETVLRRLLKQDVIQYIKLKGKTKRDPTTYVFQQGKSVDYFVLILEGRVEVTVGRENLVFEAGPFTYFGVQALTQNMGVAESPTPSAMGSLQNITVDSMLRHTFVPDYSVRAITELYYLTLKRSLYLAAKRATLMEKGALSKGATNEQFDTEVDKHLCSASSAIPIAMISKKLLGCSTSTGSSEADMLGSTSGSNKPIKRANVIELTQVSQHNSLTSEHFDERDKCFSGLSKPTDNKIWTGSKRLERYSANSCEGVEPAKKKKTTFHTDSTLLTFHDLKQNDSFNYSSSMEHGADFSDDARCSMDDDRVESEKESIDYDSIARRERGRQSDVDQLMLSQLSRIIRILEKKDQT